MNYMLQKNKSEECKKRGQNGMRKAWSRGSESDGGETVLVWLWELFDESDSEEKENRKIIS